MRKILIIPLTLLLSCHDTRSFECTRRTKTGMTITQIENIMGFPNTFKRENDSIESRSYLYDTPNGIDRKLEITFVNGKASIITDNY